MTSLLSLIATRAVTPPSSGAGDGGGASTPTEGGGGDFARALQRHAGAAEAGATRDRRRADGAARAAGAAPPSDASAPGDARSRRHAARAGGGDGAGRTSPADATHLDGDRDDSDSPGAAPATGEDLRGPSGDASACDPALPLAPTWPSWLPHGSAGIAAALPASPVVLESGAEAALAGGAATPADVTGGAGPASDRSPLDVLRPTRTMALRLARAQGASDGDARLPIGRDMPLEPLPNVADGATQIGPSGPHGASGRAGRTPPAIPADSVTVGREPTVLADPAVPIDDGWMRDAKPTGRATAGRTVTAPAGDGEAPPAVMAAAPVAAAPDGGSRADLPTSAEPRLAPMAATVRAEPGVSAGARPAPVAATAAADGFTLPGRSPTPASAAATPAPATGHDSESRRAAEARESADIASTEPPAAGPLQAAAIAAPAAPALAMTTPAGPSLPAAAATVPLHGRIDIPVDQPGFAPALGAQLSMMARDGVQQARLQLHPVEMGPIDVKIAIDGSAARVDFHAAVAATREAIEASLPTLAAALRESGLTLSGGGVFQQASGQPSSQQSPPQGAPVSRQAGGGVRDGVDGGSLAGTGTGRQPPRRGLVDLVA